MFEIPRYASEWQVHFFLGGEGDLQSVPLNCSTDCKSALAAAVIPIEKTSVAKFSIWACLQQAGNLNCWCISNYDSHRSLNIWNYKKTYNPHQQDEFLHYVLPKAGRSGWQVRHFEKKPSPNVFTCKSFCIATAIKGAVCCEHISYLPCEKLIRCRVILSHFSSLICVNLYPYLCKSVFSICVFNLCFQSVFLICVYCFQTKIFYLCKYEMQTAKTAAKLQIKTCKEWISRQTI